MGKPNANQRLFRDLRKAHAGFDPEKPPQSKRDKERALTLAGLRRLRAPVVARFDVGKYHVMRQVGSRG